jgi:type II secretory pathway predicted ATPase ExeA
MDLTTTQAAAIEAEGNSFLLGPAGTGKSTALQHRLLRLLESGEPAYTMMILVAEPEHEMSFLEAINSSGQGPYTELQISTNAPTSLLAILVTI